jgi:RHS repeat-associated protein
MTRTSKAVGNTVSSFLYNGSALVLSRTGATDLWFQIDGTGETVGFGVMNGSSYTLGRFIYLKNPMGDVVGLADWQGNLVCTYEYDAWGKMLAVKDATGAVRTDAGFVGNMNPLRYRGYFWDVETGFYYCGSRYYDPAVGRWISADGAGITAITPKKPQIDKNVYAYCSNNPINCFDPTGLATFAVGVDTAIALGIRIDAGCQLVWDDHGNVGIITTGGIGGGTPSASVSITITVTNAETIYDLAGVGYFAGGSCPVAGIDFSYGEARDGSIVTGATVSFGPRLETILAIPAELHAEVSYSTVTFLFNQNELWEPLRAISQNLTSGLSESLLSNLTAEQRSAMNGVTTASPNKGGSSYVSSSGQNFSGSSGKF